MIAVHGDLARAIAASNGGITSAMFRTCGRFTLKHQRADPAAAVAGDQCGKPSFSNIVHEMPDIFYKQSQLLEEISEDENRKSYATPVPYKGDLRDASQ